jgi:hypothetical protein
MKRKRRRRRRLVTQFDLDPPARSAQRSVEDQTKWTAASFPRNDTESRPASRRLCPGASFVATPQDRAATCTAGPCTVSRRRQISRPRAERFETHQYGLATAKHYRSARARRDIFPSSMGRRCMPATFIVGCVACVFRKKASFDRARLT